MTYERGYENGLRAFLPLWDFLTEDEWYPRVMQGRYTYSMGYSGSNGQMACYAQIRVDLEQFIFYVMCPVKAPEEKRLAVAEFIARANYGMRIGNFELDFSDGEVRYKSSLDFEGVLLEPLLIRNAIYPAAQTMNRYLPGLMGVIYSNKTPEEAIAEIEG